MNIQLKKVLAEDAIRVELLGNDKAAAIEELIDVLFATGRIHDRAAALKAVMEREAKMSTGMQNGLALPHGKSDSADRLVAAIGIKKEGIAFDSLDGQPARILVLTLSPLNRIGPHIQFLAEIGRVIQDPAVRERILQATTPAEVLHQLTA